MPGTTPRDHEFAVRNEAAKATRRLAIGYIRQSREAGHTWHDIGTAMGLTPGTGRGTTIAEAAFSYAAGDPGSSHARAYGRSVRWTCTSCDQAISDHGPENGPAGERGHAPRCQRLTRTIQAWEAEWEAGQ